MLIFRDADMSRDPLDVHSDSSRESPQDVQDKPDQIRVSLGFPAQRKAAPTVSAVGKDIKVIVEVRVRADTRPGQLGKHANRPELTDVIGTHAQGSSGLI